MHEAVNSQRIVRESRDVIQGNLRLVQNATQPDMFGKGIEPICERIRRQSPPTECGAESGEIGGTNRRVVTHKFARKAANDDPVRNMIATAERHCQTMDGAARAVRKGHASEM